MTLGRFLAASGGALFLVGALTSNVTLIVLSWMISVLGIMLRSWEDEDKDQDED